MKIRWSWLIFAVLVATLVMPLLAQEKPTMWTDHNVYCAGAKVAVHGQGFKETSTIDIGVYKPDGHEDKEPVITTEKNGFMYYYKNTEISGQYLIEAMTSEEGGLAKCSFVVNTSPKLTCPGDQKVDEGAILSGLSGSFEDPDNDKWQGRVDWGDGGGFKDEIKIDPTKKVFFLPNHVYANNGEYKAKVVIKDGCSDGICTFTVKVNNVDPKLRCPGDQKVDEGVILSGLSGSFTDPGADEWIGAVDWGDGAGFRDEIKIDPEKKVFYLPNHAYPKSGKYEATVRIKDGEGGGDCTFTVKVNDPIPPISTHTVSPAPHAAGWNNVNPVAVNITATDDGGAGTVASVHYIVDGGSEVDVAGSSTSVSVSGEGEHTVEYWAVDDVGNVETPHNNATVKIDTIPPVVAVTSGPFPAWPPDFVSSLTSGTGQITDPGGSGVDESSCEYKIDSSAWGAWAIPGGTISTNLGAVLAGAGVSSDGQHVLYGRVKDIAGNEFSGAGSFKLDDTPPNNPTVTSTSHTVGLWSNSNIIDFDWSGASDGSGSGVGGYSFLIDTNPSTTPDETVDMSHGTDPHTWSSGAVADGDSYYFHLRTVDHLGNWSATVHLGPFKIDTQKPSIPSNISPADGTITNNPSVTLMWAASSDSGSGVGKYSGIITGPDPSSFTTANTTLALNLTHSGTYTWKVRSIDKAKNPSAYSDAWTFILDTEPPQITCPGDITKDNDPGQCNAVVTWPAPTVTDNVGVASVSCDPTSGSTFSVGTTTVTCTATDTAGNTAQCSFTVTVNDAENPVISGCPADITQDNDAGICGAAVAWTEPTASDNCGIATFTSDYSPGDTFSVGTTHVTYTALDIHGNSSTCEFDVTVNDVEHPVISGCPSDITQDNDAGICGAAVSWTEPTASDNCVIGTFTSNHDSGNTFPVGTTTVTYTATDIHGNSSTCSFNVVVNDTENPVISGCPADITQDNDAGICGAAVNWTEPTASDNCGIASFTSDHASGDTFPVGTTTVTYTATDVHGNSSTCSFNVTVNDTEKPVITCPGDITQANDTGVCGATIDPGTATATDNCSATVAGVRSDGLTLDVLYPVGTTTITWTATDPAGNTDTCAQTIVVNDTEDPTITCPSDVNHTADPGVCQAAVTIPVPATDDNCSVASVVNDYNNTNDASDTYPVGTTTVSYTVTDIHGNSTQCSFDVTITDDENPVISGCPGDITQDNDAGMCGAVVNWTEPTAADNCAIASFTSDHASGDTFPVGTTTVTYTATDVHGNSSTCGFDVTVNDTEDPVISNCPGDITQDNDAGMCGAVVNWTEPTAGDNCAIASFTSDHASGDTFPVGTTTVTYTATDIHGNSSTCSFDVTVNDAEKPTAVLTSTPPSPDNNPAPYFEWSGTDTNGCTLAGNLVYSYRIDAGAWSAWSLPTFITLTGLPEGTHTFEVRSKDEAGNIGPAASYTWIIDLTDPEITITVPEGDAEYVLNNTVNSDWIAVDALSGLDTASAADDVNTDMASGEPFYTGSVGLHDFTVTATDRAGNRSTVTVTYRVVYTVNPGGAAGGGGGAEGEGGTFLDKWIAGGGGAVGITTLEAVYTIGDVIHATFSLTDVDGNNIPDAVVSCTLVKVTLGDKETYKVIKLWRFDYSTDNALYYLDVSTEGLPPGVYDLWLGFDDGTQKRLRIQLEEGEG